MCHDTTLGILILKNWYGNFELTPHHKILFVLKLISKCSVLVLLNYPKVSPLQLLELFEGRIWLKEIPFYYIETVVHIISTNQK